MQGLQPAAAGYATNSMQPSPVAAAMLPEQICIHLGAEGHNLLLGQISKLLMYVAPVCYCFHAQLFLLQHMPLPVLMH